MAKGKPTKKGKVLKKDQVVMKGTAKGKPVKKGKVIKKGGVVKKGVARAVRPPLKAKPKLPKPAPQFPPIEPDLEKLYAVLSPVARTKSQITYGDLSRIYYELTKEWLEPHGSWDGPLGELNQRLNAVGWPPLSAVVVLDNDEREPGGGFWNSSPNIPARPREPLSRIACYQEILGQVYDQNWPATFPAILSARPAM